MRNKLTSLLWAAGISCLAVSCLTGSSAAQDGGTAAPPEPLPEEPLLEEIPFAWPAGPGRIALPAAGPGEKYLGFTFDRGELLVARYRTDGDRTEGCAILVLDPATGTVRAAHDVGRGFMPRSLAVIGDTLYLLTSGSLYLLDRETFARRESIGLASLKPDASWWFRDMATADGDTFHFIFSGGGAVYRWVRSAGTFERWSDLPEGGEPYAIARRENEIVVLDPLRGLLYGLDAGSGTIVSEALYSHQLTRGYRPIAFQDGSVWTYNGEETAVRRLLRQAVSGTVTRSDPVRARIEARVTVRNTGSRTANGLRVIVAAPESEAHQTVSSIAFNGPGFSRERDRYGSLMAVFTVPRLAPGEETAVGWTAEAVLWNVRHRIGRATAKLPGAVPRSVAAAYLTDGLHELSPGDRTVDALAAAVARPDDDAVSLVGRARDEVWKRLVYKLDDRWDDAAAVLAQGHGSCTEYSFLLAALLRRNGVPARFVDATINGSLADREDRVYHRWIETWLPGYGWAPVDANSGDGDDTPAGRERLLFGDSGATLIVWRGGGEDERYLGLGNAARAVANVPGIKREIAYLWKMPD